MMGLVAQWQWHSPLWLWALLYPPLLLLLGGLRRRTNTARLIDRRLWPWMLLPASRWHWRRLPWTTLAWWLGWSCLVIALAGPRLPDSRYQAGRSALRDVMVVVDVSRSMTATDVHPSRLRRARLELESWLPRVRRTHLGLVVYGARPHLVAPLTGDLHAFRHYLVAIDDDMLPTEGSAPIAALQLALAQFPKGEKRPAALLLLSDGGYDRPGFATAWAALRAQLRQRGIPLYVMGIGTPEGAPLLAPDGGWLRSDGKPVVVRLWEARLHDMAQSTGGAYTRVAADDSDWDVLYRSGIAHLGTAAARSGGEAELSWQELYPPFLVAAVVLLLLSLLRRGVRPGPLSAGWLGLALAMGMLHGANVYAEGNTALRQADTAYSHQDYESALGQYARLQGYRARMGEASAAYQLQRYPHAIRQYTLAFLAADTDQQRADALYDLGECRFRQGDYAGAESLYRDVLRYAPRHRQASINLPIATSLRKAVEERLRPTQGMNRPGRGLRRGRPKKGQDLGHARRQLDADSKAQPYAIHGKGESREALIERGIRYSEVASGASGQGETSQQYDVANLRALAALPSQTGGEPANLWRRLFETEEGYPAPVGQPNTLPGRTPW